MNPFGNGLFSCGCKIEDIPVHAEALAGRLGAVIEHMPKMGVAAGAADCRPGHAEAAIGLVVHAIWL